MSGVQGSEVPKWRRQRRRQEEETGEETRGERRRGEERERGRDRGGGGKECRSRGPAKDERAREERRARET